MISNLKEIAQKNKEEYKYNKPFEHIKLENLFSTELLDDLLDNILEIKDDYQWWKLCTSGNDFSDFGKSAEVLTDYLVSDEWTNFLSELTGIDDLRSDKSWYGAGINFEPRGSHLEPHTDFNKNANLGWRRVNVLLFLSKGWKDEWGGHNELGHINEKNQYVADKKYLPEFNHLVIFNTSDISYHGFDLVKCDEDNARIVISCYYYSDERGDHSKEQETTRYVGWDKERNMDVEYNQRRGTGWKELK